jgi:hypothetical protein
LNSHFKIQNHTQGVFITYGLTFLGLTTCLFIYLSNLEQYFDVSLVDEPSYLISGIHFFDQNRPVEYGPLYSFWYWVISHFYTKPVDVFYFNMKAMMLALPLSSFIMLALMRIKPVLCFLFSYFLVCSYLNTVSPFVGHFTEIIILSSFAILANVQLTRVNQILFVSLVFLFCTYFRPEYKLSFALAIVYIVIDFIYKKRWQNKTNCYLVAIFFTVISTTVFFVGNPFQDKTNRTLLAFEQHYAFNYCKRNNLKINPFIEYKQVMKKEFGELQSVSEYVKAKPEKILTHIFQNILNYLWCVKNILIKSVLPSTIFLWVLTLFSVAYTVVVSRRHIHESIPWYNTGMIALYTLSALPSLISVIFIAPRYHYLTTQYHLVLFPLAIIMYKLGMQNFTSLKELVFTLIIILVVFFKGEEIKNSEYLVSERKNITNITLIENVTKDLKNLSGICNSGFLLQLARPDAKIFLMADLADKLKEKNSLIVIIDKNREPYVPTVVTTSFRKIVGEEIVIYLLDKSKVDA